METNKQLCSIKINTISSKRKILTDPIYKNYISFHKFHIVAHYEEYQEFLKPLETPRLPFMKSFSEGVLRTANISFDEQTQFAVKFSCGCVRTILKPHTHLSFVSKIASLNMNGPF